MRPITDDVVLGLMKGLQTREKNAIARRAVSVVTGKGSGSVTSRILALVGPNGRTVKTRGTAKAGVRHADGAKPLHGRRGSHNRSDHPKLD